MDPAILKFVHYVGIFFLLAGLGGLIFGSKDKIKLATMSHGIGLLLLLLGGFGMQGMLKMGFPVWLTVKVIIWLVLGGIIVAAKRELIPPVALWLGVVILCGVAAWLGMSNSVILK